MEGDYSSRQGSSQPGGGGIPTPLVILGVFAVALAAVLWRTDTSAGKPPVPSGTSWPGVQAEGWLNAPVGDDAEGSDDVEGSEFDINAVVAAGDVVFVDCMASWCGPCLAEMPRIVKAADAYRPLGVQFVSLSMETERDAGKLQDFLDASPGADWPLGYGCKGFFDRLGIQGIPTFIIFVDGEVSWSGFGGQNFTDALDAAVAVGRSGR